jgi:uncharacterized protein (DUF2336 family)
MDYAKAPPSVVGKLARDVEREVSEPILRFCTALSDDDLLDILSNHPEPWVISAIAGRPEVSVPVSGAVVDTDDVPATTVLVNNSGASLGAETLQKIVERAHEYPEWHGPIVMRRELSLDLAQQLAGFVDEKILHVLEKRGDFDPATRQSIAAIVRRRMDYQRADRPGETAEQKVARMTSSGSLSVEVVQDALAWQQTDFVILALAQMTAVHPVIVKKILASGTAKPVVALCWKGQLPMRFCIELQRTAAKLQPADLLYAKGGTDYPLTPEEMKWQLEFFGAV